MRLGWLLVLGGCTRVSEAEFVPVYVDVYCDRFFECADDALLTFEGLADLDDCKAVIGPEVSELSDRCELVDKLAQDCIDAISVVTCPSEGTLFSDVVPTVCDDVWTECEG